MNPQEQQQKSVAARNKLYLKRKFGFDEDEMKLCFPDEGSMEKAVSRSLAQARDHAGDDSALAALGLDADPDDNTTGDASLDAGLKREIAAKEAARAAHEAAMQAAANQDSAETEAQTREEEQQ